MMDHSRFEFVGRYSERQRLRQLIDDCQNASPGLVLLTGPPGIGKSALARHVLDEAEAAGTRVARSRYTLDTCTNPYGPFLQALSELAPERTERLQRWYEDVVPAAAATAWDDCEEQHFVLQEARESWESQLVEAYILAVRHRPAVVEIADLYLATETAWRFLSRLLQAARNEPLLVLSTLRLRDDADRTPNPLPFYATVIRELARGGLLKRIRLEPLTPAAADELIRRYAPQGALRRKFLQHLHAVSRGNPGLLHDEVQRLVESGALQPSGNEWIVDEPRFQSIVREDRRRTQSVHSVPIEEEIDAVLGHKVSGDLRQEVMRRLKATRDKLGRFLRQEVAGLFRWQRRDMDIRARERVLAALTEDRRRRLHYRVAQVLEPVASTPGALDLVAYHYAASDQPHRALPYFDRLAEESLRGFAFTEARRYYRRQHAILVETGRVRSAEYVGVDIRLSWLERLHGEAKRALGLAQEMLVAETARDAGVSENTVLLQQALALRRLDDHEAALSQLRGCLQATGELRPFLQGLIFLEIGVAEFALEHYDRAKDAFLRALERAKSVQSEVLQVRVLRDLGAVEMALEEPLKAIGYFGQSVSLLKRIGDKRRLANVYFFLGLNQAEMWDWTAAYRSLGRALALSDHLGLHHLKADAYFKRSLVLLELGRFSEARQHAREASRLLVRLWEVPLPARNPVEIFLETVAVRQPRREDSPGEEVIHLAEEVQQLPRLVGSRLDAFRQQLRERMAS